MKIIDFHVHVFADKIADKAVKATADHYLEPPESESGTLDALYKSIEGLDIYKMVVHSTATKPSQVVSINNFLCSLNDERFIHFGTLHPDYEDVYGEVERMVGMGIRGIKLHPDFQAFNADEKRAYPIYDAAQSAGLPILCHVGDVVFDYSNPHRIDKVARDFPRLTIVAAHLGGREKWDEGLEYLVKHQNVMIDTSSAINRLGAREAIKIIRAYGIERTLFATDFPMGLHKMELKRFMYLDLTDDEREKILYRNAANLLGIE